MRIALINVQCLEGNNIVPPLGILLVAARLEQDGHSVRVFDADPDMEDVADEAARFDPQVVGLGFFTNTYQKAKRLLETVRRVIPRARIVLGGIHCSSAPLETFLDLRPDYLVVGEGEAAMSALLAAIERKDRAGGRRIGGVYSWRDGEPVYSGPPERMENLDEAPFPARHLLDFERYLTPPGVIRGYAMDRMTTIITSRGCHYSCIYCASHNVFGARIRRRSVENVLEEIRALVHVYGIRGFYICDDLFTSDTDWALSFCDALLGEPVNLRWACQSRVDTLPPELLRRMAAAGCVQIDFGVESGSASTLKTLHKKTSNRMAPALFRELRQHGVRACATFIIGAPDETLADIEETYQFAKTLNADFTVFYYATPYPGTSLHAMAIERGWLEPGAPYSEDWNHRQARFPLMDAGLGREALARLRKKMQNRFFVKNYLSAQNVRFLLTLTLSSILRPRETFRVIGGFLFVGRFDDLVEGLLKIYRRSVFPSSRETSRTTAGKSVIPTR